MDEPIAWPFWKFGLKRDDLFTTLQDRYNTFPSSIQDPEAFHHDVFELSHAASTAAEFHRLMAERKQHRLRELNESLESASFEIIANPSLIGTDQWQYAVQLFRTRSLDSLVRYFASYLPEDHPWRRSDASSSSSSDAGTVDSIARSDNSDDLVFSKYDQTSDEAYHHYPLSPRSMTMYSDSSVASQNDTDHVDFSLTPARTMSFSESEPDQFPLQDSCPPLHHDDASSQNPSDGESSSTSSVSDESEAHHKEYFVEHEVSIVDYEVEYPQLQLRSTASDDAPESETPTPKPRAEGISARLSGGGDMFFPEPKPSRSPLSRASSAMPRLRRCDSPSRTHLSLHAATLMFNCLSSSRSALEDSKDHARDYKQKKQQQQSPSPSRLRRRDHSPAGRGRRSTGMSSSIGSSRPLHNGNSGSSRIQKPVSEPLRSRPRGRRLDDC